MNRARRPGCSERKKQGGRRPGDEDIDRRFQAFLTTIGMASRSRRVRRGVPIEKEGDLSLWPVTVAARELREALVAYQERESPSPARYPTSQELISIVHKGGNNRFEAIDDWLVDHEIAFECNGSLARVLARTVPQNDETPLTERGLAVPLRGFEPRFPD